MHVLNLLGHLRHNMRGDGVHAAGFLQSLAADFEYNALILRLWGLGGLVCHLDYLAQSRGALAKTKECHKSTPRHLHPPER